MVCRAVLRLFWYKLYKGKIIYMVIIYIIYVRIRKIIIQNDDKKVSVHLTWHDFCYLNSKRILTVFNSVPKSALQRYYLRR